MSKLIENISSEFFEAANKMKSIDKPKEIIAYVEDIEDIPFWSNILKKCNNSSFEINFMTASHQKLQRGKTSAIKSLKESKWFLNSLGNYMIACIDSDYDYLITNYSDNTDLINKNDYILQTYFYSVENHNCNKDLLDEYCMSATFCKNEDFNLIHFINDFSEIIYKLHLLLLFFLYKKNENYNISKFNKDVSLKEFNLNDSGEKSLKILKHTVTSRIKELTPYIEENISEYNKFEKDIKNKGLNQSNTYLYIQGHNLQDNVILKILHPLTRKLYKGVLSNIKSAESTQENITNRINQYRNQTNTNNKGIKIEERLNIILKTNKNYNDCDVYNQIKVDIDNFLKNITN